MGFRPMARIEIGSCSGSGQGSSAAAAFRRIFDIALKLYIGVAGKRARAWALAELWLLCTAGASLHAAGDEFGCQRGAALAKTELTRGPILLHWGTLCFELRRLLRLALSPSWFGGISLRRPAVT